MPNLEQFRYNFDVAIRQPDIAAIDNLHLIQDIITESIQNERIHQLLDITEYVIEPLVKNASETEKTIIHPWFENIKNQILHYLQHNKNLTTNETKMSDMIQKIVNTCNHQAVPVDPLNAIYHAKTAHAKKEIMEHMCHKNQWASYDQHTQQTIINMYVTLDRPHHIHTINYHTHELAAIAYMYAMLTEPNSIVYQHDLHDHLPDFEYALIHKHYPQTNMRTALIQNLTNHMLTTHKERAYPYVQRLYDLWIQHNLLPNDTPRTQTIEQYNEHMKQHLMYMEKHATYKDAAFDIVSYLQDRWYGTKPKQIKWNVTKADTKQLRQWCAYQNDEHAPHPLENIDNHFIYAYMKIRVTQEITEKLIHMLNRPPRNPAYLPVFGYLCSHIYVNAITQNQTHPLQHTHTLYEAILQQPWHLHALHEPQLQAKWIHDCIEQYREYGEGYYEADIQHPLLHAPLPYAFLQNINVPHITGILLNSIAQLPLTTPIHEQIMYCHQHPDVAHELLKRIEIINQTI